MKAMTEQCSSAVGRQQGSQEMDKCGEDHGEGQGLDDYLQYTAAVQPHVVVVHDVVQVTEFTEVMQVEESEEDAEPMPDLQIEDEEAEGDENEEQPKQNGLKPEKGRPGSQEGCGTE
jgi:hypothetical protein